MSMRTAAVLLSPLALSLLSACAPQLDVGDPCALTSDCPEPLVCLLGRCRSECTTYRDCGEGEACLTDEISGARACRTPIEASCTSDDDCGALACARNVCVQRCAETEDCAGTICVGEEERTCIEPTGTSCTDGSACAFGVCSEGFCDPVRSLAAGGAASCVLLESGRIACAGNNPVPVLSAGGEPFLGAFTPVRGELVAQPPFEAIDLGSEHACALGAGRVRCWGSGTLGQNGSNSIVPPIPSPIATVSGVLEVSSSWNLNCLRTASAVYCFGTDQFGELGDAVVHPGTFPSRAAPQPVELPVDAGRPIDIDVGGYHGCAVIEDGRLYCWGANDFDQIGSEPSDVCPYFELDYACHQAPVRVEGFGPGAIVAVEVALGQSHTCVRDAVGAVYCFGQNLRGQLGNGMLSERVGTPVRAVVEGVAEVVAGRYFTCARFDDGGVACWGENARGQLGTAGGGGGAPALVEGVGRAVDLVAGLDHACVLNDAGEVYCWGEASDGRLGDDPDGPAMRDPALVPVRARMGSTGF